MDFIMKNFEILSKVLLAIIGLIPVIINQLNNHGTNHLKLDRHPVYSELLKAIKANDVLGAQEHFNTLYYFTPPFEIIVKLWCFKEPQWTIKRLKSVLHRVSFNSHGFAVKRPVLNKMQIGFNAVVAIFSIYAVFIICENSHLIQKNLILTFLSIILLIPLSLYHMRNGLWAWQLEKESKSLKFDTPPPTYHTEEEFAAPLKTSYIQKMISSFQKLMNTYK